VATQFIGEIRRGEKS